MTGRALYQIEKEGQTFNCVPTLTPYVWMVEDKLRPLVCDGSAVHAAVDVLNALLLTGWRPPPALEPSLGPRSTRSAIDDLLDDLGDERQLDVTSPEGDPIKDEP